MVGEILRDVGVLVLVFGPLDALFARGRLTPIGVAAIVVIVGPCLVLGVLLGLDRHDS